MKRCALHGEDCPGAWCAFWLEAGCELERLDLSEVDPQALLGLRLALERERDARAAERAAHELTLLAPPDLSGA
jgi:hypothetical protein